MSHDLPAFKFGLESEIKSMVERREATNQGGTSQRKCKVNPLSKITCWLLAIAKLV